MASDLRKRVPRPFDGMRRRRLECAPPMSGPRKSDAWSGMGTGWAITSTLVAGMIVGGGLGFLIDLLLGTDRIITGVGIVLGAGLGIYIVYLRYGKGGK